MWATWKAVKANGLAEGASPFTKGRAPSPNIFISFPKPSQHISFSASTNSFLLKEFVFPCVSSAKTNSGMRNCFYKHSSTTFLHAAHRCTESSAPSARLSRSITATSPELCNRALHYRTNRPRGKRKLIGKIISEEKLVFKHTPKRWLRLAGTGGRCSMVCCNARHEQALKEYKICSSPQA